MTTSALHFTLSGSSARRSPARRRSIPVTFSPLTGPPPAELPLPTAPLVRVLVQIRFLEILSVERRDFIATFQEAIRKDYPVLTRDKTQDLVVGPQGVLSNQMKNAWRFADRSGSWRVSLASSFLALETASYGSRSDLLARLRAVLEALGSTIAPTDTERLGVRYVNRVEADEDMHELIPRLVRPEVAGVLATELRTEHSITENVFSLPEEEAKVTTRWGLMPAGRTLDPSILNPVAAESWILDLDVFQSKRQEFSVDRLVEQAGRFAQREYTIFRWAVTDAFLKRYGGQT